MDEEEVGGPRTDSANDVSDKKIKMINLNNRIKIAVLGSSKVGKTGKCPDD